MKRRGAFNKATAMFSVLCMLNTCVVSAGLNVIAVDNGKMNVDVLLMYNERYASLCRKKTEAQSLYTDGLLKGNENGLDLLKPLTRIEGTAILVRAMGVENEQISRESYFADIASDNWGAKYANIAKTKALSRELVTICLPPMIQLPLGGLFKTLHKIWHCL